MEMKEIYQFFDGPQGDGRWYKEWMIPADFPTPYGYTEEPIPEGMVVPKYILGIGWVEDDSAAMKSLENENEELKSRIAMAEGAILDLADMILSR